MTADLAVAAADVLNRLRARGMMVATAESCTGGLIAAALTAIAGSSDVVDRGFVTYSNAAKTEMLGVDPALIRLHGAVSAPVAAAMAQGALQRSQASSTIAVTGVAGPGGGTPDKPVGTVWFGLATRGAAVQTEVKVFPGNRDDVRAATVLHALHMLSRACDSGRDHTSPARTL
ncbi:MAG TPA: nicotinamide-nucleotide amidohydrolase family protein [Acetobacteraceae bacterium]